MTKEVYEKQTLAELKEIAKGLNIKNISKFKKSELIEEIINNSPRSIEKDGVILKEKISPKLKEETTSTVVNNDSRIINKSNDTRVNNNYSNSNDTRVNNNYSNSSDNRTFNNNQENRSSNYYNNQRDENEETQEEKRERLKVMINVSDTSIGVLEIQENNSFLLFS